MLEWNLEANTDAALDRESYDYQILHKTIFAEARGEPELGQRAVAWVIRNRAEQNRDYWGGESIAGVCLQPSQFECWNSDRSYLIDEAISNEPDVFNDIDSWLPEVYLSPDPTEGADFYNNPDIEGYPPWTENVDRGIKIGNHQFYKSRT
jgi:N-acetylmuramoyl-L-alanine amidase